MVNNVYYPIFFAYILHMKTTDKGVHDKSQWQGTNWLGECIMRVREELKVTEIN